MVPIMWKIPTEPWFLRCLILGGKNQSHFSWFSPKISHLFTPSAWRPEGVPLQRQAPGASAPCVEASQDAVDAQHQAAGGERQRRREEGRREAEEPLAQRHQAEILGTWDIYGK